MTRSSRLTAFQHLCDASGNDPAMFAFLLPKVELHAHLNGSISLALLHHLSEVQHAVKTKGGVHQCPVMGHEADDALKTITDTKQRMQHCFIIFDQIYMIMDNLVFTRIAVQDVLFHYAAEHTLWLEIRTSLREGLRKAPEVDALHVSQADYLSCVQEAMHELLLGQCVFDWTTGASIEVTDDAAMAAWFAETDRIYCRDLFLPTNLREALGRGSASHVWRTYVQPNVRHMACCLTVSISRGQTVAVAEGTLRAAETVLAKQQEHPGCLAPITSIDFSGNCYKNAFTDYLPALEHCRRRLSLQITLHAGEKDDEKELRDMMDFVPDRWGHLVYVADASRDYISQVLKKPIELCPSSNLLTCGHDSMDQHHIAKHWVVSEYVQLVSSNKENKDEEEESSSNIQSPLSTAAISINTDDRGVFVTSMTEELLIVSSMEVVKALDVDVLKVLFALQWRAIDDAFVPAQLDGGAFPSKKLLKERFAERCVNTRKNN